MRNSPSSPVSWRTLLLLVVISLLGGCALHPVRNPNLQARIDPTKAEVVGSHLIDKNGAPHQAYFSSIDGTMPPHLAFDQTLKLWSLEPGRHAFTLGYFGVGDTGSAKSFSGAGSLAADLLAGHRYILKTRPAGGGQIVFYFEDMADGREVAVSGPVRLR